MVDSKRVPGLLDHTLIIWAGEFDRSDYHQVALTATNYGCDYYPRYFSIRLAGAGVRPGATYGETDDFNYNTSENRVHVRDLQAPMKKLLRLIYNRPAYRSRGRNCRLADMSGEFIHSML